MSRERVCVSAFNVTRGRCLAVSARVADSYFPRLVGLLGRTREWAQQGNGLWIVPSRGVHTLGMLFPIDVVFLDSRQVVVDLEETLPPFRISKIRLQARSVLELPPHTILRTGTRVGDHIIFQPVGLESPGCDRIPAIDWRGSDNL